MFLNRSKNIQPENSFENILLKFRDQMVPLKMMEIDSLKFDNKKLQTTIQDLEIKMELLFKKLDQKQIVKKAPKKILKVSLKKKKAKKVGKSQKKKPAKKNSQKTKKPTSKKKLALRSKKRSR